MRDKLRVGLIGAGRMAGFHIDVLSTFDDTSIISLAFKSFKLLAPSFSTIDFMVFTTRWLILAL